MASSKVDLGLEGEAEVTILVKAAPNVGKKHGEMVCCAGLDAYGQWIRMFPISFRHLPKEKQFKRWDRVRFKWRLPDDDPRPESRRVDSQSLTIVGRMPDREKQSFLAKRIVGGLAAERAKGRTFALLKPQIDQFIVVSRSAAEIREEQHKLDAARQQPDFFTPDPLVPVTACPYSFKYKYRTDDGEREGTCQDWETEATFFRWKNQYGETKALDQMRDTFGKKLPERGLYFAMGTHSLWPDQWLINGLIQLENPVQDTLF